MKRLTRRQREMSREALDGIAWEIRNITNGIARREARGGSADLPQLLERRQRLENLRDQAIVICETEYEMDRIAENSWS